MKRFIYIFRKVQWIILLSLIFFLTNCTSIGPKQLPYNRKGFSEAMITSEEQQLLLNLVRIQFADRPYFVGVDSITTSNSLSANLSSDFTYSPSSSVSSSTAEAASRTFSLAKSFDFTPSISYSDSPTVSFTPLQGEKFTRQMLSPVEINAIYLLLNSGWGTSKVFRTLVERIENRHNDSVLFVDKIPHPEEFVELADYLQELHKEKIISFDLGLITHVSIDPNQKY